MWQDIGSCVASRSEWCAQFLHHNMDCSGWVGWLRLQSSCRTIFKNSFQHMSNQRTKERNKFYGWSKQEKWHCCLTLQQEKLNTILFHLVLNHSLLPGPTWYKAYYWRVPYLGTMRNGWGNGTEQNTTDFISCFLFYAILSGAYGRNLLPFFN